MRFAAMAEGPLTLYPAVGDYMIVVGQFGASLVTGKTDLEDVTGATFIARADGSDFHMFIYKATSTTATFKISYNTTIYGAILDK